MSYAPGPAPTEDGLLPYVVDELRRISDALSLLETDGVHFHSLDNTPNKDITAMVVYAKAGVLGVNEGVYRMDSGGSWAYVG